ncbi:AsnC family transcriptional regulator [Moorella sulfitireducens]|uniref:siroheme decarboxylase subunit alpha n=1 Tax=Neomoorella sulfitireducens TaxID=2972948 RepID=UPI0021ABFE67|nr:AsnC family transcriptional regulator [Moorella sulfitireducens]
MDSLDRRLLNMIQEDFPLTEEPYAELGRRLGLKEAEILERLAKLKEKGIIRRIGAVFDLRRLGYTGTLCAMKVPEGRLSEVAAVVNSFPGVTHNYLREDAYNMWFTLIGPCRRHLEKVIANIETMTGLPVLELPAEKSYKIRVNFNLEEGSP